MKTLYKEIEISYNEEKDRWEFELRGRSRSAESPARAKEAIDKEPVEKRKQVFPRFDAYQNKHNRGFSIVNVTSIANNNCGGAQFWISSTKDGRQKEYACSLFPVNENNTAIVTEIKRINAQIDALDEVKANQHSKLQPATMPTELA